MMYQVQWFPRIQTDTTAHEASTILKCTVLLNMQHYQSQSQHSRTHGKFTVRSPHTRSKHHFPFTTCTITIIVYKRYMYYYAYTEHSAHSLCNTSLSCLPTCTGRLVSGGFSAGSGVRKGWFCSYQLFAPRKARLLTVESWYLENHLFLLYLSCTANIVALPLGETEMRETCYSSNCGIRTTEDKRVA